MMDRWVINENPKVADYYVPFGDSLLTLANELRTLENGFGENLRRASHNMSIHIHKVLIGSGHPPLLNCIQGPRMPPLVKPRRLRGDPYELYPPTSLTLSPPESGVGTGLSLQWEVKSFPLYGLSYNAKTNEFSMPTPWDYQRSSIRLKYWHDQNLIQVNHTRHRIGEITSLVRNQRGAHSDPKWISAAPRPLVDFYWFYLYVFIVHVGRYLVDKATEAVQDEEFRIKIFPDDQHPTQGLNYAPPKAGVIRMKGPGMDFIFSEAIVLSSSPPSRSNKMGATSLLWCLKAPEQ